MVVDRCGGRVMARVGQMSEDELARQARASQVQALLHDVEDFARAVEPEAMAALLEAQGGEVAEPFPLARAWLDAVRASWARRQDPPVRPFALRRLRVQPWVGPERRGAWSGPASGGTSSKEV